jgi:WhiB family redox-sensing transcriptional regulator
MTMPGAVRPWAANNTNGQSRSATTDDTPVRRRGGGDWRDLAACREEDPELFFPAGEGSGYAGQIADAKEVCEARCPVRDACLADAMKVPAEFGIRGGLTAAERKALKRRVARTRQKADAE